MRSLVLLLVAVAAQAVHYDVLSGRLPAHARRAKVTVHVIEPMAVVPDDGDVLLEVDSVQQPACRAGHKCPLEGGECCLGGDFCCPFGCNNDHQPITCKANEFGNALVDAQKMIQAESQEMRKKDLMEKLVQRKNQDTADRLKELTKHEEKAKKIMVEEEERGKDSQRRGEQDLKRVQEGTKAKQEREESAMMREEALKSAPKKLVLAVESGWSSYGNSYRLPSVVTVTGPESTGENICFLSGLAAGPDTSKTIAHLPESCRPRNKLSFDLHLSRCETAQFDIDSKGQIMYVEGAQRSGGNAPHWISLAPMAFTVSGGEAESKLPTVPPWVDFGAGYQGAQFHEKMGLCIISGKVATYDRLVTSIRPMIAVLEPKCTPKDGIVIFSVNHGKVSGRVDINTTGHLLLTRLAPKIHAGLSLAGIIFFTEMPQRLKLEDGWILFNKLYRSPSWIRRDTLCVLSGMARPEIPGNIRQNITRVPEECRPDKRLVFYVPSSKSTQRLDVLADGMVQFVEISPNEMSEWISLDGLRWVIGAPQ